MQVDEDELPLPIGTAPIAVSPKTVSPAAAPSETAETGAEEEGSILEQLSPWAVSGVALGTLALLVASLVGWRMVTIGLSALGVVAIVAGIPGILSTRRTNGPWRMDRVSLAVGGSVSGVVLLLALFAPKLLNSRWGRDLAVPPSEPNKLVRVLRNKPQDEGDLLADKDWVDARKEAIRQDEVLVRVESFQVDRRAAGGDNTQILVHLRVANAGHGKPITFTGFSEERKRPVLKDDSGHGYPFVEQRRRKPGKGPPVFEAVTGPMLVDVKAGRWQDELLVFEAPAALAGAGNPAFWKLEIPASAWGREGVCQFRIPAVFDAGFFSSQ
jgi:hypothetical protein